MKTIRSLILLFALFPAALAISQVSHGGLPHFLQQPSLLRVASNPFFIEMPSFDLDSILMEDAMNERNMSNSYRFAHKFYTHIDSKDAAQTILPDGTTVKQIGIRSAGAFSINLIFRDFEIPPGGKLFIYSADHSHVIGSFDHRNNSPDKIFPTQPVAGESIIVEYSEPADVPFTGHFTIAEVNHDYRDVFRVEPNPDYETYDCMPDVNCNDAIEDIGRSTVLLIISGRYLCTGVLLNNTSDDRKHYLLTATHCLCHDKYYPKNMDFYNGEAATIIAFFNYNRPACDANIKMKGTEEMSIEGATSKVILENRDIALLELKEIPDYYNAFYAGWNRDTLEINKKGKNHINIHHPSGAVKKYGETKDDLKVVTLPQDNFWAANSFWEVTTPWTRGSTHAGSSGSPLFGEDHLVIGGLYGGESYCPPKESPHPDWFSILGKGWETNGLGGQLKSYLDPKNTNRMNYPGLEPNKANPIVRLNNAKYSKGDVLIKSELASPNKGFVFGNSNLQTREFAEEYTLKDFALSNTVEIFGVYLLLPDMPFNSTTGVTVSIYTGDAAPETQIVYTQFIPRYRNYTSSSGFHWANKSINTVPTETFVKFDKPVVVTNKFYVSYKINYSTSAQFCVYNTKFQNANTANKAWLKHDTKGWVKADAYEYGSMKTSLAIHPLVRNTKTVYIEPNPEREAGVYFERSERVLTLKDPLNKQGEIAVYSIGGLLLEKIRIQPDQTSFVLGEQPKGTVGIVKITSDYFSLTEKIMY